MTLDPAKGHAALRRGRYSQVDAEHFLTICTADKRAGLTLPRAANAVLSEGRAMSADCTWVLHCAVVMPDHVHLLVTLGARLSLERSVQRMKARTAPTLRSSGLRREHGFFDRKLRAGDERLPVYHYIYLNPYRAGLVALSERWPYFYCRDEEWQWFQPLLENDLPYPEWLKL
jgi:putative transposase